ncbi:DUF6702 family protein [uncultured Maribacter sp.]|uniref:DUF6702 family protein n=1 Tax=uncultured Maribacter sp. TaxID=431308 RepID=UPI0030EE7786|tara:strand:- start:63152 stop:63787 length:636 start_codon:yes stop_codon:yes gene_type:complete
MFKKIIVIAFVFFVIQIHAHQADVSTTMLVEKENNSWILQISCSLTAFQHEIRTHYSETPYQTPEEFKQMVLAHLKKNLHISFNGNESVSLSDGVVILGHETKVVFEVFGIPSEINSVIFKNSAFKDIHKNQSALMLFKKDFSKEHFVLNDANSHTLNLEVNGNGFIEVGKNEAGLMSYQIVFALIGIMGIGFIIRNVYRLKKNFARNNHN